MGITPATEILSARSAGHLMDKILGSDSNARLVLWLGSRSQIHTFQHNVGNAIAGEPRVTLMIKNQMWPSARHWIGIVKHVLDGGATLDQLWLCHRGFAPEVDGYRNPPDLQMAMEVQHAIEKEFGATIPMIGDPSHIAGSNTDTVLSMAQQILAYRWLAPDGSARRFSGLMTEVHPFPDAAKTDRGQQLSWDQFDTILDYADGLFRQDMMAQPQPLRLPQAGLLYVNP